uniref:Reverse transcriptase domain-containing protein n=1 Tax=Caenorhabditis tropicalis TaxID=1561998 RepID=A0A1I7T844_9PELO
MERIVCRFIKTSHGHKFHPNQHGFLSRRSCTSSLARSISEYKETLLLHNQLDVIYLDFQKAFDRVSHPILLSKLANFGLPSLLLSWFDNFLSDRSFSIKVNEFIEPTCHSVPSGVPQGTVSGPLLFLVFINDIFSLFPPSVKVSAFADDLKLSSHLPLELQASLDIVDNWSSINRLPLAHSKTALIHLGKSNTIFPYSIRNTPIKPSDTVRDLGLLIDSSLSFKPHISRVISLATLRSNQLLKSFSSSSPQFYAKLFKTYVWPIIEYCSPIYAPPPSSLLAKNLEKPLRQFSRKALQKCNIPFSSYSERLAILDLPSCRHRRLRAQLILLYKFLDGTAHFPDLFSYISISNSSRRPMIIKVYPFKTNDFFSKTVPSWNAILANTNVYLSPSQFINLIDKSVVKC